MELESTQGMLADVDIDAMFNSTSVDDFMRLIGRRGTLSADENVTKQKKTQDAMDLITNIVTGKSDPSQETRAEQPKLDFGADEKVSAEATNEALREKAMQNLRKRRLRLK